MVDSEGKELDVVVIEVGDDCNTCEIVAAATKLRLRFLMVPVKSGSRIGRDTGRNGGRCGDDNVDGKICGGIWGGAA